MASSHQHKVAATVHVKSTSSFDDGRGFRKAPNHEQSNPYKSKDSFRGGPHRGRGTSSHRGHTRKDHTSKSDHTAVEVRVVLDQATISDAAKPCKGRDRHHGQTQKEFGGHGRAGSAYRGQYDKPYRGPDQNSSEVFKSDSSFYNPMGKGREKDQSGGTESCKPKDQSRGRGQIRGGGQDRGRGRGRGHDRGRGGITPQIVVVNNYIVQESSKKGSK